MLLFTTSELAVGKLLKRDPYDHLGGPSSLLSLSHKRTQSALLLLLLLLLGVVHFPGPNLPLCNYNTSACSLPPKLLGPQRPGGRVRRDWDGPPTPAAAPSSSSSSSSAPPHTSSPGPNSSVFVCVCLMCSTLQRWVAAGDVSRRKGTATARHGTWMGAGAYSLFVLCLAVLGAV